MTGDVKFAAADATKLIDEPFSAKVRIEDGVLLLREVRCAAAFGPGSKPPLASSVLGHYRPMTDKPVLPVKSASRWQTMRVRAESFVQGFPGLGFQTQASRLSKRA